MKRTISLLALAISTQATAAQKYPLVLSSLGQSQQIQVGDELIINSSTIATAPLNIPQGVAPASPGNGDIWTTSTGLYARINGATQGPFSNTTGTTTSVGLALPSSVFTVSGSPVTSTGTLTGSFNSQLPNMFFAAPNGSSGTPVFRTIASADVPVINIASSGNGGVTGVLPAANGGTGVATTSGNFIFSGPNGSSGTPAFRLLVAADIPPISLTSGVSGVLPVANGGTNASTAATARTNIGAASSGANADITSLLGLSTAITVAQGGTGASTAAFARTNLGLGTAAVANIGQVGSTVPFLNNANTWDGNNNFNAATYVGEINSNTAGSNWIETLRPASTSISQFVAVSSGGFIGSLAGSRSSDNTCTGGCQGTIGLESIVWNNNVNSGQIQSAYAGYFEATRESGAGTAHGLEIDVRNRGTLVTVSPTNMFPTGATPGVWIASGAGQSGTANNSAAIGIVANGSKWDKGIVFDAAGLALQSNSKYEAISLARLQTLTFYDSTGAKVGNIFNNLVGSGLVTDLEFDGDAIRVLNGAGGTTVALPGSGGVRVSPQPFSSLPTCNSTNDGTIAYVNDAASAITAWHQQVTAGGGSNKAFVTCNSSTWNAWSY